MKSLILLATVLFLFAGCKKKKENGQIPPTTNGQRAIVLRESNGKIIDIWKLNSYVGTFSYSTGCHFTDQNNNDVAIGLDGVKVISFTNGNDKVFNSYVEYHQEDDTLSYYERKKRK